MDTDRTPNDRVGQAIHARRIRQHAQPRGNTCAVKLTRKIGIHPETIAIPPFSPLASLLRL
jgi:hypothetical protein